MIAFIIRRLGVLGVILFGSSFILYNLAALAGDPLGDLAFSDDEQAQQQIAGLRRQLRLDVPAPLRYFIWLKGVLGVFVGQTADFGLTRENGLVLDEILMAVPTTIRLVTTATLVAIVLGVAVGITSALRQYSRFDYSMTFVVFLLYSLPIFWVAVLLKQFLAIEFNNFLSAARISTTVIALIAVTSGFFWASIIGIRRKSFWMTFLIASVSSALLLIYMNTSQWFIDPSLGALTVFVFSIGIAFATTHLSVGLSNKSTLYASLSMAALALVIYYPIQTVLNANSSLLQMFFLWAVTIAVAFVVSLFFGKIDRGPLIRTTIITASLCASLIVVDKYMRTWRNYM